MRNVPKKFTVIIVILLTTSKLSFSQCDTKYDKIDDFTGSRLIGSYSYILGNIKTPLPVSRHQIIQRVIADISETDTTISLELIFLQKGIYPEDQKQTIIKGDHAYIKLTSGDVITLTSYKNTKPRHIPKLTSDTNLETSSYFKLTKQDIEKLKLFDITKIRVEYRDYPSNEFKETYDFFSKIPKNKKRVNPQQGVRINLLCILSKIQTPS